MTLSSATRLASVLLLAATSSGCCTMARFFCGPDDSTWVSESFESHAEAITTLREAIRRDSRDTIYRSLSEGFKKGNGLHGGLEVDFMWSQLQKNFSGVHLLGYAEVSEPEQLSPDRVRYQLSTAGYIFEVDVVRQAYWEVLWDSPNLAREAGNYESIRNMVGLRFDDLDGSTEVRVAPPPADGEVTLDNLKRVTVGHNWKIDYFNQVDPDAPADSPPDSHP